MIVGCESDANHKIGDTSSSLSIEPGKGDDYPVMLILDTPANDNDGIEHMNLSTTMEVIDYLPGCLRIRISNRSGYPIEYDNVFTLYVKKNGEWVEMTWPDGHTFSDEVYFLEDMEEKELDCDIMTIEPLDSGEYRICKGDLQSEFRLVWTE